MLSIRTYLRSTRKNRRGESVIYFIVANEWISTDLRVDSIYWDPAAGSVKKNYPHFNALVPQLLMLKAKAEACILQLELSKIPFSKEYFTTYIFEGHDVAENPCFIKLIRQYCSAKDLSWSRVKHYNELINDITAVITRPKLKDIDFKFSDKFRKHLRGKKKPNNDNTIIRKFKQLKAIVHYCQALGILQADPLAMVKLKQIKGNKKFLTIAELQSLETLYSSGDITTAQKNVLQYFLFSCYTALRFSDVEKLQYSEIKNNCVETTQEKTDVPVIIPLISRARALLQVSGSGKCFRVIKSQPTNRILKELMVLARIDKTISYHCSRHTFGTMSITLGIPREVVAELMGVDESTVKIYAQIVDDVKIKEMGKWELPAANAVESMVATA